MLNNPYTPGAGCIPPYLAGRNEILDAAQCSLQQLKAGYPQRSVLYYGLRGVGKTAMLNAIEGFADNLDILYAHIEAIEDSLFLKRLIQTLGKFLRSMSIVESAKALKEKCVKLLASFSLTYELNTNTMGLSMSLEESLSTGLIIDDLSEVFVALGKLAKESRAAVCVFIDELQFLQTDQIRAMVTALHRCNQLRLPISIFCAGLPKSVEVLNRSCSYSERLFEYVFIDKLAPDEAAAAITEPAESLGVHYQSDAVDEIVITTSGYPYFIQEYCSVIWNRLPEGTRNITHEAVISSRKAFYEKLDTGFFEARYSRCSPSERTFMLAMTRCAELPCQINEIASNMKKNVSQISPIRATLIEKGIVYAPVRGELDFTVPLFGQYLRRNATDD